MPASIMNLGLKRDKFKTRTCYLCAIVLYLRVFQGLIVG